MLEPPLFGLTLLATVVFLPLMRDMRSSELLSESSLSRALRLAGAALDGALDEPSESLESNDGIFLVAVLEAGLGLDRASMMDGCFASGGDDEVRSLFRIIPQYNIIQDIQHVNIVNCQNKGNTWVNEGYLFEHNVVQIQ